ncbi:MAG: glucose-1-phosphate adenylyltransferase subunit GlgD [Clostridiales Family XIII bacterium]|jgi:glucose-1-phosphate adenylyltransferase|nr:glucose-1-phosphate adenylyltransferase subunit GlgD [Clostridiales Family XIII bacterium]
MRGDTFGMIYAGEQVFDLRELVDVRSVGALPVGGRYRVIDFPLSNMVNSGIRNVAVIASRNYNSLVDHLGSGKAWDLSRKSDGLFFLTPFANRDNPGVYRGAVEALKSSMDYLKRAKQPYCIISDCRTIYNTTYDEIMDFHISSDADVTILYNRLSNEKWRGKRYEDTRIGVKKGGEVNRMEMDMPETSLDGLTMGAYIIRRDLLVHLVDESYAQGGYHFFDDMLRNGLGRIKIMGFEYKGYVSRLHNVASYYQTNMDFLDADIQKKLFQGANRIYTKVKDEVPARYLSTASVKNSIVANGCIIEGEVENCVLFRGVYIGKGTTVKSSIILPGAEVNDDAELENVVIDKNVVVRNRTRLIGSAEYPMIIQKGAVV